MVSRFAEMWNHHSSPTQAFNFRTVIPAEHQRQGALMQAPRRSALNCSYLSIRVMRPSISGMTGLLAARYSINTTSSSFPSSRALMALSRNM